MHYILGQRLWAVLGLIVTVGIATTGGCGAETFAPPILPESASVSLQRDFADALVNDAQPYGEYLLVSTGLDRQVEIAMGPNIHLDAALQVLDRETLETVGRLRFETDPMDIEVVGKTAYIASGDALVIVDLSVPSAPSLVTSIPTAKYSRTVVHTHGLLVVGQGTGTLEELSDAQWPQLWVLDISADPHKPVPVGTLRAEGQVSDLVVGEDGWVYAAEWDAGVGAYNVVAFADAGKETTRRYAVEDGSVDGVELAGDHLYAALVGGSYLDKNGEIRVFDATGSRLDEIASVGVDVWVRDVVARDEGYVLYVGVAPQGSHIGAAAPEWGLDPVVLVDYRGATWQFALDLVDDGDRVHALVAQPTGKLDLSGAGGCAIQIDELDTSLRSFEIE